MKRSGVLSETGLSFCQGAGFGVSSVDLMRRHYYSTARPMETCSRYCFKMGTSLIYQLIRGVIVLVSSRLANLIFQSICCVLVGVVSQTPQFVHGNPYDSDP